MARTKVAKKSARAKADIAASGSASSSAQSSTPNYAPSELLDKAEAILARAGPDCLDLARKFATRASKLLSENGQYDAVQQARAGEVLGMCCLEEGDENGAREIFTAISQTSSTALLYLAQLALSPHEAITHFQSAIDILSASLGDGVDFTGGSASNGKDRMWSEREREVRTEITKALVSMTELYLTDLCFEVDAETRCSGYLDLALRVDAGADVNPEIYSTLASVRLSQSRVDDARNALEKSFSIWRDLPTDAPAIPAYVSRLGLARLLVEVDNYDDALDVLEGLEDEDDEEPELLYLLGLANWLKGERSHGSHNDDKEYYVDAREALERFLQLHARRPDETDPDMLAHVSELIQELETVKGVTMTDVEAHIAKLEQEAQTSRQNGQDGEDGWEDVGDDEQGVADSEMA